MYLENHELISHKLDQYVPQTSWSEMNEYLVIYEDAGPNWAAYVPDLPGCVGVGRTKAECRRNIAEGIGAYIQYLVDEGQPVPAPPSQSGRVEVA